MSKDQEFGELLEKYIAQEDMLHFEGRRGIAHLEKIAVVLGYRSGFMSMLADNPFLQEALVEALLSYTDRLGEWSENLIEELKPKGCYCDEENPIEGDD